MSKQERELLFEATDFRPYVRAWATARGRGEYRKIAQALRMHTTLLSQILGGRKCLTEEQAVRLCEYLGLLPLETDFFLKLVQLERSGSESLTRLYRRQLQELRDQSYEAKSRVPEAKSMTEADRALFYSSWQFTLVRLMTSIDRFQTPGSISDYLGLPVTRVREILEFLVSRGLCEAIGGRFRRTEKNTHIEARSPLAVRHHQNWRTRAIGLQEAMSPDDLAFTAPVSISRKDFQKIRGILLDAVAEISKKVEASPCEEVAYFGIDWIKL